jgi:hypothetical protein
VERAFFTGKYTIREVDSFPELQANNFSGFCYAWRRENGITIVLPVDSDNAPHGNCYLMDDRDFAFLFQPSASTAASDDFMSPPPLRSDSPDLLNMWYEHSLSNPPPATASPDARRESDGSLNLAAISNDEKLLTPVWLPDEMFFDMEGNPPSDAVHAFAPHPPIATNQPAPPANGRLGDGKTFSTHIPQEYAAEDPENPESRMARLEQRMRSKFDLLLQAMDENINPKLEEEMTRLLALGSSFDRKQKFMFTEFGLALRRKQKFTLALNSHLRALELAPNDEHILFNVARAEYELRNLDKARYYLDKALSIAPNFTVAKNFQSFLLGHA